MDTSGAERFGAAATLLAGQTALLLGWRPHEFWAATPAELAAIFAAHPGGAAPAAVGRDYFKTLLERNRDG